MDKEEVVKKLVQQAIKKIEEFGEKLVENQVPGLVEHVKGLIGLVKKILQLAIGLLPKLGDHVKLYAGHVITMMGLVAVADMVFNTAKYVVLAFYLKQAAKDRTDNPKNLIAIIDANLDSVAGCLGDANTGFDALVEETTSLCDPSQPPDDDMDQLKALRDGIAEPAKGLYTCFGELRKSKGTLESTIVAIGKTKVFQDSVILELLDISTKKEGWK